MSANSGTWVIAPLTTPDSQDVFATHLAALGKGGFRTVATLTERDNITTQRREEGMCVWVVAATTMYQLVGGVTNSNWQVFSGGGSSVGIEKFTVTAPILSGKQVTLANVPTTPAATILTLIGGLEQQYSIDFTITGAILSWAGLGLDGYFQLNDKFSVIYK